MRFFLLALAFLTKIPVKVPGEGQAGDLPVSAAYFPAVGGILGGFLGLLFRGMIRIWPPLVAGIMLVAAEFLLTGGLHLDGLADFTDGWFAGGTRERQLQVMKDSRVGAMGAAAVVWLVLAKVILLAEWGGNFPVMLLYGAGAKMTLVLNLYLFPYARERGTGLAFAGVTWRQAVPAAVMTVLFAAGSGFGVATAFAGSLLILLPLARSISRNLYGLTGDVYGALHEIFQITFLLFITGMQ